jgi:hypothetical protein
MARKKKFRQDVERALTACRNCIIPPLPTEVFDFGWHEGEWKMKFGEYEFDMKQGNGGLERSVSDQVISAFITLLPFVRRRLMYERAGCFHNSTPAWLFTTHKIVAHWLVATGAIHQFLEEARSPWWGPLPENRFVLPSKSGRSRLVGQTYCGFVGGTLFLTGSQQGIFSGDHHVARLVVDSGVFPEAYRMQLAERLRRGPINLSSVFDFPLLDGLQAMIASVEKRGSSVLIDLDPSCQTLAPVPKSAMELAPIDCNPSAPWDLTIGEAARLRALVKKS